MPRLSLIDKYNELKRPLILDGAQGSYLQHLGDSLGNSVWTGKLNIEMPAEIEKLHEEYIYAGADIITTNTFRTNPASFKYGNINCSNEEFIKAGIDLALGARGKKNTLVAGSNAPAEDCYQINRTLNQTELEYNHKFHIDCLWEFGVDTIWNETFSHLDEIKIVCKHCSANNIPFTINLFYDENLKILSGESIYDIIDIIKSYNPIAIGFNCIKPINLENLFQQYTPDYNWGFYLNCGSGNYIDKEINCGIEPQTYWQVIKMYLKHSPIYVGSCCGSGPEHTRIIKEKFSEIY